MCPAASNKRAFSSREVLQKNDFFRTHQLLESLPAGVMSPKCLVLAPYGVHVERFPGRRKAIFGVCVGGGVTQHYLPLVQVITAFSSRALGLEVRMYTTRYQVFSYEESRESSYFVRNIL